MLILIKWWFCCVVFLLMRKIIVLSFLKQTIFVVFCSNEVEVSVVFYIWLLRKRTGIFGAFCVWLLRK